MANSNFLCSNRLNDADEIVVGGSSLIDSYDRLQQAIADAVGRDATKLFAEPVVSRSNGAATTSVSWYADYDGNATPLTKLDLDGRAAAERLLSARIEALRPAMLSSPDGQLIAAALYVRSVDDIFLIKGEPLLTNWGVLPEGLLASSTNRERHFRETLGRVVPGFPPPPLDPADWENWRRVVEASTPQAASGSSAPATGSGSEAAVPLAAAAAAGGVAGASSAQASRTTQHDEVVAVGEDRWVLKEPWYRRPWLPAAIAVALAAIVLILLLIPGVLLYPDSRGREAALAEDLQVRRAANDALQDRLESLRRAQNENVCTLEGDWLSPEGLSPYSGMTPVPRDEVALPGVQEIRPDALIPPPPERLVVTSPDTGEAWESEVRSLVDLLDATTVLIVAGIGAGQTSMGTGFFVDQGTIVTNLHVVEQADPQQIFVTSAGLGGARPATMSHRSVGTEFGSDDFAILRGDFPAGHPVLALSDQVERLDNVVAAGYPLLLSELDADFQRLVQGDQTASPQLSLTNGMITVVQPRSDGMPIIAHTAPIAQGNSGGPLVDLCGQVVGVNTFTRTDQETAARANYSLHSTRLARFLSEAGIPFHATAERCRPRAGRIAEADDEPAANDEEPSGPDDQGAGDPMGNPN